MRQHSCSWLPVETGKSLDACTRVIWSHDPVKPEIEDMVSLTHCRQIRSPDGNPASLTPCKLYFDLDLIQLHAPAPSRDVHSPASSSSTSCCTGVQSSNRQADCEVIANSDGKEGGGGDAGGGGGCTQCMSSSPFLHQSSKSCTLSSPKSSSCSSPFPSSSARTSAFIPCFFFSDTTASPSVPAESEEEIRQTASSCSAAAGSGAVTGGLHSFPASTGNRAKIELHKISILSAAKNIELYQCLLEGEKCCDRESEEDEEKEEEEEGSLVSPLSQGDQQTCWQNHSHDMRSGSISTNSFPAEKRERKKKKMRKEKMGSSSNDDEYVRTGRGELIEDAGDGDDCSSSGEVSMYSASVEIDMGKSVRRFRINLIPRQASLTTNLWIFAILIEIRASSTTPPFSLLSSLTAGRDVDDEKKQQQQRFWESLAQNITPLSLTSSSGISGMMAQTNSFSANTHDPGATFSPNLMLMSNLMMHMMLSPKPVTAAAASADKQIRQRRQRPAPDQECTDNNKYGNKVSIQQKKAQDGKCNECNLSHKVFPEQPFIPSSSERHEQGQHYSGPPFAPSSSSSSLPFPFLSFLSSATASPPNAGAALAPMTGTMNGRSLLPDIRSQPLSAGRTAERTDGMHADTSATVSDDGDHLRDAASDVHHEQETGSDEGTRTGKLSVHQQQHEQDDDHDDDYQQHHESETRIRRSAGEGDSSGRECDTFSLIPVPSLGSSVSSVETLVPQSGQLSGKRVSAHSSLDQQHQQHHQQGKNRHANHHFHPHYAPRSHCDEGDDHLSHLQMMQFLHHGFNQLFLRLDQMDERIGRIEGHLKLQREQEKQ